MAKGYLILNSAAVVVSTHKWGGDKIDHPCPIVPETGGAIVSMTVDGVDEVVSLMIGGQVVSVVNDELRVNGETVGNIVDGEVVFI